MGAKKHYFVVRAGDEKRKLLAAVLICIVVAALAAFIILNTRQATIEINVLVHNEDFRNTTVSRIEELGVTWVSLDYEWTVSEDPVSVYKAHGIKTNAIIDNRTIDVSTLTPELWNDTMLSIVTNEQGQMIDAFTIMNEPNGDAYVTPENFTTYLKSASQIIRNYTKALVIAGALAPIGDWETYYDEVFGDSDIWQYYDYQGVHLYGSLSKNLEILNTIEGITPKQNWITEIGQPSETGNYTENDQNDYAISSFTDYWGDADKVFWYEFYDDSGKTPAKENYFGLLRTDNTEKPSFTSLKALNGVGTESSVLWYNNPIVIVFIIVIAVCAFAGLLVYFKKHKR